MHANISLSKIPQKISAKWFLMQFLNKKNIGEIKTEIMQIEFWYFLRFSFA